MKTDSRRRSADSMLTVPKIYVGLSNMCRKL